MNKKNVDIVNFESFAQQHMGKFAQFIVGKRTPIQVYPLSIAFSFIKPPIPLFRTDYNFFLLLSSGGGEQQVDNKIVKLNANDVLFIREGHLNAIKSILSSTDGYFIYVDSLLLPQIFDDKTLLNRFTFNPKHSVSKVEMKWLAQCCTLLTQHQNEFTNSIEIAASLLKAVVLKLAQKWPAGSSKSDRQSEIAIRFKELVYENFMHRRDVKFYANALSVSENYLNRCVKHITNKAPKKHINEVVIYHSKALLMDLSKDVSQVAFELNFSDPSYFGRLFKLLTNQTPTEYRDIIMQDLSEQK